MTDAIPAKLVTTEQKEVLLALRTLGKRIDSDMFSIEEYELLVDVCAAHNKIQMRKSMGLPMPSTPQREQDGGWEAELLKAIEHTLMIATPMGPTNDVAVNSTRVMNVVRSLHRPAPVEQPAETSSAEEIERAAEAAWRAYYGLPPEHKFSDIYHENQEWWRQAARAVLATVKGRKR
jgi:hypothetical protein